MILIRTQCITRIWSVMMYEILCKCKHVLLRCLSHGRHMFTELILSNETHVSLFDIPYDR